MRKLFCVFFLWLVAFNLQAMTVAVSGPGQDRLMSRDWEFSPAQAASLARLYVAEQTAESAPQPEPGSLVIPGEEQEEGEGKKCMNVCKRWGEDCQINPRTGDRKCRRTCKEFGQECF